MNEKFCPKCLIIKPIIEFGKYYDGYQKWCKLCRSNHQKYIWKTNKNSIVKIKKKRQKGIREWWIEFKKKLSCVICGENHVSVLDFHHINPQEKEFTVSFMRSKGYSKENILKEIEKCIVLCANCHRKLHWKEKYLINIKAG